MAVINHRFAILMALWILFYVFCQLLSVICQEKNIKKNYFLLQVEEEEAVAAVG